MHHFQSIFSHACHLLGPPRANFLISPPICTHSITMPDCKFHSIHPSCLHKDHLFAECLAVFASFTWPLCLPPPYIFPTVPRLPAVCFYPFFFLSVHQRQPSCLSNALLTSPFPWDKHPTLCKFSHLDQLTGHLHFPFRVCRGCQHSVTIAHTHWERLWT